MGVEGEDGEGSKDVSFVDVFLSFCFYILKEIIGRGACMISKKISHVLCMVN